MGRRIKNARPRLGGRRVHLNKYIAQRGKIKMTKSKRRAFEDMESQAVGPITMFPRSFNVSAVKTDRRSADLYPRQYEVWFAELGYHYGTSIQSGCRPVLIISNNTANRFANTLTAVPLTTRLKRLDIPTHVLLEEEDCEMFRAECLLDSMLLIEQMSTIDKSMLRNRLCRVKSREKIAEVKTALKVQLGEETSKNLGMVNNADNSDIANMGDNKLEQSVIHEDSSTEESCILEDMKNSIETEVNTSGC